MLEPLSDAYLRIISPNVVTLLDFSRSTQLWHLFYFLFIFHQKYTKNAAVEGEVCGLK